VVSHPNRSKRQKLDMSKGTFDCPVDAYDRACALVRAVRLFRDDPSAAHAAALQDALHLAQGFYSGVARAKE
jgi:hypothetical protein